MKDMQTGLRLRSIIKWACLSGSRVLSFRRSNSVFDSYSHSHICFPPCFSSSSTLCLSVYIFFPFLICVFFSISSFSLISYLMLFSLTSSFLSLCIFPLPFINFLFFSLTTSPSYSFPFSLSLSFSFSSSI